MAILINVPARWITRSAPAKSSLYKQLMALADSQAKSKTLWYLVSMIMQGVFFLPIPALLIYYFNAPIIVLAVTPILFFANIIAGIGGEGIRILLFLFAFSLFVHFVMLAMFIF